MTQAATQVWLVDLDQSADALLASEQETPRLSPHDRARLDALSNPADQRIRRATYIAQRIVLEATFGPAIRQAELPRDQLGRPHLPAGYTGSVSLAHTGNVALIAASHAPRIGVDLEVPRAIHMGDDRRAIIQSAAEALSSQPLPLNDPQARFLQAWTRLEALAKADGHGIGHLLTQIGVIGGQPSYPKAAQTLAASHNLTVHDLDSGPFLFAAIATPDKTKPAVRPWPAGLE